MDAWFSSVMDVLLLALRSAPSLDDSIAFRLASLAENVEIIVECGLVGWIGGRAEGAAAANQSETTHNSSLIIDAEKIKTYRKAFGECTALAASCGRVRDRLFAILDAVDGSLNASPSLISRLNSRQLENKSIFEREMNSLGRFVTRLTRVVNNINSTGSKGSANNGTQSGRIVQATVDVLSNEHTINALGIYRDKHWSVMQRVNVWTMALSSSTSTTSSTLRGLKKPNNWISWLKQLLVKDSSNDKNDELLVLSLSVATELMTEHVPSSILTSDQLVQLFSQEIVPLMDDLMKSTDPKQQPLQLSDKVAASLQDFQEALIQFFIEALNDRMIRQLTKCAVQAPIQDGVSIEQQQQQQQKQQERGQIHEPTQLESARFLLKEKLEQAMRISDFLCPMTVQSNQLLLHALQLLSPSLSPSLSSSTDEVDVEKEPINPFLIRFIGHLYSNKDIKIENGVKKKLILDVYLNVPVIDLKTKQKSIIQTSLIEKAIMERWIGSPLAKGDVTKVCDWINSIKNSRPSSSQTSVTSSTVNRLLSPKYLTSFDLLTKEESQYVRFIERRVVVEALANIVPSLYLNTVRNLAIRSIFKRLVDHFHRDVQDWAEFFDRLNVKDFSNGKRSKLASEQEPKSESKRRLDSIRSNVARLKKAWDRAYFFAKHDGREFEWLVWLDGTVLPSLQTGSARHLRLETISQLLLASAECGTDLLFHLTVTSRPHQWIDNVIINSFSQTITARFNTTLPIKTTVDHQNKSTNQSQSISRQVILKMAADMRTLLNARHRQGPTLVRMLAAKLDHESKLVTAFAKPIDHQSIGQWIDGLKSIRNVTQEHLALFNDSPVRRWIKVIRHIRLTDDWSSTSIATQLVNTLDRRFGPETTDAFLRVFRFKYVSVASVNQSGGNPSASSSSAAMSQDTKNLLNVMLRNMSRYPWVSQKAADLASRRSTNQEADWLVLQDDKLIEKQMKEASKEELNANQLIETMRDDLDCRKVIGSPDKQNRLLAAIADIRRHTPKNWNEEMILNWVSQFKNIKNKSKSSSNNQQALQPLQPPFNVIGYLSVASAVVYMKEKFYPRDSQLLAVLIFTLTDTSRDDDDDDDDDINAKRMAQISTGEGKTLITALLAGYHVLDNWLAKRHVNVITSSTVLAEANVVDTVWFFQGLGISVSNNCDAKCADDDKERRQRYDADVVYGDLSSFQRDHLLGQFYGRDVTKNRSAGALIIDEVDSMLLDKGENVLYLSHKIPEMNDLLTVFVDVWFAVQDLQSSPRDEKTLDKIKRFVLERMERGESAAPVCLRPFIERHLLAWIRSAYRAKHRLSDRDAYKVDDVGDGRGKQIVVMDKETGVEQVNMQWTNGLHQFLQLKHSLRLSPVSLKAVFMSNIGFFNRHKGALYGLTGTLGSVS